MDMGAPPQAVGSWEKMQGLGGGGNITYGAGLLRPRNQEGLSPIPLFSAFPQSQGSPHTKGCDTTHLTLCNGGLKSEGGGALGGQKGLKTPQIPGWPLPTYGPFPDS